MDGRERAATDEARRQKTRQDKEGDGKEMENWTKMYEKQKGEGERMWAKRGEWR